MQALSSCGTSALGATRAALRAAPEQCSSPFLRPAAKLPSPSLKRVLRPSGQPKIRRGVSAEATPETGNGVPVGEYGQTLSYPGYASDGEDIKLECDESGCVLVRGQSSKSLEESQEDGYLNCNVTGCFYTPEPPEAEFKVLEGKGWRMAYETAPASEDSFVAMVGSGGWSIGLTASEFHDFCKLIQMLRNGIITMDQDGVLGRDDIVMQVEKGSMWMECVVPKKTLPTLQRFLKFGGGTNTSAFEIRFILTAKSDKRQAEGCWPADAVMDMLKTMEQISRSQAPAAESPVPATA